MLDDLPNLPPEALDKFTDAELAEYVAMLEDKRREIQRRSFKAFARAIPLPGAPDQANIMATHWERKLAAEKGRFLPEDKPDVEVIEFYKDRLDPQPHHDLIMDAMQDLVEGELVDENGEQASGVMIFCPPGSAKSSYATMLAPAYFQGRFPGFQTIIASYAQSLTNGFSRRVQSIVQLPEYQEIFPDAQMRIGGVEEWEMTNNSRLRAAGITGGVTGFRCDLMIIDDVVKNAEDADSEIIRDKVWEEFNTTVSTRFKGTERIAIIMTRWHTDDLAGRILSKADSPRQWRGESGFWRGTDKRLWYVLRIPMIADREDDPLGRKIGEQLWPEVFSPADIARRRAVSEEAGGTRDWLALYQQTPTSGSGNIIRREWWRPWVDKETPPCSSVYLFYDTAFEANEAADFSAMTAWGIFERKITTPGGREHNHHQAVLLGGWRDRVDAVDLASLIVDHTDFFGSYGELPVEIFVEKRASGAQIIQELRRRRYPVRPWLPKGPPGAKGKVPRMYAAQFPFEQGAIWFMPQGKDVQRIIDEVCDFPNVPSKDWSDTVSMAMDVFRRRFMIQMMSDELDDAEYEAELVRKAEAEEHARPRRRLYG